MLTTGVRIYAGIDNQNIDIATRSDNVVNTAETNIISPTVTTDNPYGFFNQIVGDFTQMLSFFTVYCCQFSAQSSHIVALSVNFHIIRLRITQNLFSNFAQFCFHRFQQGFGCNFFVVDRNTHTQTKFSIVFKQRVCPSRTMTFFIFAIRSCRQVTGIN